MIKIAFLEGVPLFDALVRGEPPHTGHEILSRKTKVLEAAHGEDFVTSACTVLIQCQGVPDERTDRRTDGRQDDG